MTGNEKGRESGRVRTIRVEDDLWEQAQQAKHERGDPSLSYVIRRQLRRYVSDTPSVLAQRQRRDERDSSPPGSGQRR